MAPTVTPELVTPALALLFFVSSWTVMTIAMMLPTSLPILTTFSVVIGERRDRPLLLALVVVGYLLIWALFGVSAHLGQVGLRQAVLANGWAASRWWMTGGVILMLAGLYQFTPLKHRCLEKCRSPLSFVIGHWQGRDDARQAFRLGIDHGLFCVGCCWALMLLMFVVGTTSLVWMLLLGIVMAIEKNVRWGRRLSAPVGVLLLCWGTVAFLY